jgi:hypothetical protein
VPSSAVNPNSHEMILPQLVANSSSNDAAMLPVVPIQPGVKLESKDDDSDEEGEIDEESEDIGNLYNDVSGLQSSSANLKNEEHYPSAHDAQENDTVDDDDDDMFGDDNSNLANETRPILKNEDENLSENDEADMFDDSDDEIGSDEIESTAVLQKDNVTTLESGLAFALDYSPGAVSSELATTNSKTVEKSKQGTAPLLKQDTKITTSKAKRLPTEMGIIILKNPNTPNSQVFPSQLMVRKGGNIYGNIVAPCVDFCCVGKECPHGKMCNLGHINNYNILGQEGFDALCEHLHRNSIGWVSAEILGKKQCLVSLNQKYHHLIGATSKSAADNDKSKQGTALLLKQDTTVTTSKASRPGQRLPTEMGIIILKNPNTPNIQVFPSQLKVRKGGNFVDLCVDFCCVGKECPHKKMCNLGHISNYNILGQEGFDALCEHLHRNNIGWVSAEILGKKQCPVSLNQKYQHLKGDANGLLLDSSPDTVASELTSNSKNAGISWADNDNSKEGTAPLLEQDATVTASKVLAAAHERIARSVLKKPRYSSNVDSKTASEKMPNITRPSSLERSYYQQVHPDKFWAELRNWDFLSDLNQAFKSKKKDQDLQKGTKRTLDESYDANKTKASLPDTFESVTQYKALWAPLLIEEAKAQIMSEVVAAQSSPNSSWIQNTHLTVGAEVKAEVSTSARASSDYEGESSPMEPTVIVRLKRGASIGCQVFPNDLLLFSPTSSSVELALRGIAFDAASDPSASHLLTKGRFGFVGRALNHRSGSVDGLLVRVSQKLWAQFSSLNELFVIKIGSNITAVREFNALMRIDNLPLNKYLLDGKMPIEQDGQQPKGKVLDELPLGFQTFLKSKANSSQLDAISAAAREYGKGGFTLIKGPPGKFSLCIQSWH